MRISSYGFMLIRNNIALIKMSSFLFIILKKNWSPLKCLFYKKIYHVWIAILEKNWNESKCSQLKTDESDLTLLKQGMPQCIPIPQGQHNAITDLCTYIYPLASNIIVFKNHLLYLKFLK